MRSFQVLCRALGGKVGKACGGWDLGLRKVKMSQNSVPSSLFDENMEKIPTCLAIMKCHQDEVYILLPPLLVCSVFYYNKMNKIKYLQKVLLQLNKWY